MRKSPKLRRRDWSIVGAALLVSVGACKSAPAPVTDRPSAERDPRAEKAARAVTALASLFEAAAQVSDPESMALFVEHGIATQSNPALDESFPVRRALVDAVAAWPEARKRSAFDWVRANVTWTTQLHAMALESFDEDLEPTAWGPSMSRFAPAVFENRVALAPLLREALEDAGIRRVAEAVASQPAPFQPSAVRDHRAKLLAYLRMADDLPEFPAFFDPLLAHGSGVNAFLPDGAVLTLVGPPAGMATASMILFHEMAHAPVDRVLGRPAASEALEASRCTFESVESRFGYDTWGSFFAEALVRSLSYRLEGIEALDTGLVFEEYLTDELERWEAAPGVAFEDAVVAMLRGVRERQCGADGQVQRSVCPPAFEALPSGTCFARPAAAHPDAPVVVYLHGMTTTAAWAKTEWRRFARAASDVAVLAPLGRRGECTWSPEVAGHHCWPTSPDRQAALHELVELIRSDLGEVQRLLGRETPIAPILVGFSNGGYAAARIAATTGLELGGLVVAQGGPGGDLQRATPVPTLLLAAKGDPWQYPTMQSLRDKLTAAGWPAEWVERDGAHGLVDEDYSAIARFLRGASAPRTSDRE